MNNQHSPKKRILTQIKKIIPKRNLLVNRNPSKITNQTKFKIKLLQ